METFLWYFSSADIYLLHVFEKYELHMEPTFKKLYSYLIYSYIFFILLHVPHTENRWNHEENKEERCVSRSEGGNSDNHYVVSEEEQNTFSDVEGLRQLSRKNRLILFCSRQGSGRNWDLKGKRNFRDEESKRFPQSSGKVTQGKTQ